MKIDVLGAGIVGLWQAFMLRRQGHDVTLWDCAGIPGGVRASGLAGAMLAPYCEGEPGHELALKLGLKALPLWRERIRKRRRRARWLWRRPGTAPICSGSPH